MELLQTVHLVWLISITIFKNIIGNQKNKKRYLNPYSYSCLQTCPTNLYANTNTMQCILNAPINNTALTTIY